MVFTDAYPEHVPRGMHMPVARSLAAAESVPGIRGIGRVCRIHARSLRRAPPTRSGRAGMSALGRHGARGEPQLRSPGRPSTPKRRMRRVGPERPWPLWTGGSDTANAGEAAYPGYNPGAGEGLRPFEPEQTRAPVDCAGGGVAPLPPVTAQPDG